MAYQLAIDLGATYTAAAVRRSGETEPEVVPLETRSMAMPSVVFLDQDGSLVVGEAAERRSVTDPERVVREFKRRIGDDTPLLVGGQSVSAHELAARVVCRVVDSVAEREGEPPARVVVTHPAGWGPHKQELLAEALAAVGLAEAELEMEPQAAAAAYASRQRVQPGATVGVYDLGGGTFDAAVVRKTPEGGFELLGRPEGVERLGGQDFDQAVFEHVRAGMGGRWDELDAADPTVLAALGKLRQECRDAKEALSADTEVAIPVIVPGASDQVRLVRPELEEMIRPQLEETAAALERAIASAGLQPADLSAVLLVGGSSRIPLVAELISANLDRPVAVDADPKTTVALGALAAGPETAEAAAVPGAAETAPAPSGLPASAESVPEEAAHAPRESAAGGQPREHREAQQDSEADGPPDRPEPEPAPMLTDQSKGPGRQRVRAVAMAIAGALLAAGGLVAMASTVADGEQASGGPVATGPPSPEPRPGASSPGSQQSGDANGDAATDPTSEPGPHRHGANPAAASPSSDPSPTGLEDETFSRDSESPSPEPITASPDPTASTSPSPSPDPTSSSPNPTPTASTSPSPTPTGSPSPTPTSTASDSLSTDPTGSISDSLSPDPTQS